MSHTFYRKGFLAIAVATALGVSSFAQADVKIGVAGPMTGANASFGQQYMKGAQAAADAINAAGGVNGEKIVLVAGDDACEPKQAVAVANRLVDQDKVIGVVGHFCSSSTIPASEVYSDAGVIAITPGSTNPTVTERGLKEMFRMCGRDDQQGVVAGDYIVDVLKGKKVAVINDKDTYGKGLADATAKQLVARGVKPVLEEGLTRGEKDFSALVTKIRSTGADVVYFGGLHPEAGPLVRQMREQGLKDVKFMSDDGIVTDELVTTAGGAQYVDGVYRPSVPTRAYCRTARQSWTNSASPVTSLKAIPSTRTLRYRPWLPVSMVPNPTRATKPQSGLKRTRSRPSWVKKPGMPKAT